MFFMFPMRKIESCNIHSCLDKFTDPFRRIACRAYRGYYFCSSDDLFHSILFWCKVGLSFVDCKWGNLYVSFKVRILLFRQEDDPDKLFQTVLKSIYYYLYND